MKLEEIKEELWKKAKYAQDYPESWYVIPVLDVIKILEKEE